ncbi:hypothetical protein I6N90_04510 [Paenibacillus sp. GSMTC-2017]|uniref:hypothetical protein n=1 Tax=Paenibacillus sp. GSMTC-2017 TaxID=2794350 RepID=UPI0018D89F89|nr:hypothetical protein [Paenibacillus sp. GSMTC-2017]MBH5317070.1 hypothetical protein [Paenibacillus sp. GSMTC-2017]
MKSKKIFIVFLLAIMAFVFTIPASAASYHTTTGSGNLTVTGNAFRAAYPGSNEVKLYKQGPLQLVRTAYLTNGSGNFSITFTGLPQGTYTVELPGQPWSFSNVQVQFN